jgi:hypothetical protein
MLGTLRNKKEVVRRLRSKGAGLSQSVYWLATYWKTGRSGSIPGREERIFPSASVSRWATGPTQPPVQWVPRFLSPELNCGRGVTLTTHPHLVSRPALRPTEPPVQWVPRFLSPGLNRDRGMTLTTHLHLVPRSRIKSYTSFPPSSSFMVCSGTAFLAFRLNS